MKISDILSRTPVTVRDTDEFIHMVTWNEIFPFDVNIGRDYGWSTDFTGVDAIVGELDIHENVYWADNSQHLELNCIFIQDIPVVLYETTDSWDSVGQVWILDADLYMGLYAIVSKPKSKDITVYALDAEIESDYIGVETPL